MYIMSNMPTSADRNRVVSNYRSVVSVRVAFGGVKASVSLMLKLYSYAYRRQKGSALLFYILHFIVLFVDRK